MLDHLAGMRRVDELALADVDAHVVHGVAEREKIARLDLGEWHFHPHLGLVAGVVGQHDAVLGEDVAR